LTGSQVWAVIVLMTVIICATVILISLGDPDTERAALSGLGSLSSAILGYLVGRNPPAGRPGPK
jgi:hypothetical protein